MDVSGVNMSLTVNFQFDKGVPWDFIVICIHVVCVPWHLPPCGTGPEWAYCWACAYGAVGVWVLGGDISVMMCGGFCSASKKWPWEVAKGQ